MTPPSTTRDGLLELAARLTKAQRALLVSSHQDDVTISLQAELQEGVGVEIRGAQYRVARSLSAIGLGSYTHGSPYYDMYWNNGTGLAVREILASEQER